MMASVTFRHLESKKDRELIAHDGTSPLEMWYKAVRDKPIDEFTYNDLCKACRQQVFPEAVVPIAIERLRKEPLAGEMYDGELIAAMTYVDRKYWSAHPSQALDVTTMAKSLIQQVDDDLRSELAGLLALAPPSQRP